MNSHLLEQCCGKGDQRQKDGREKSCHDFAHDLPFQNNQHPQPLFWIACICVEQFLVSDPEQRHVFCLFQPEQVVSEADCLQIEGPNHHLNGALLHEN